MKTKALGPSNIQIVPLALGGNVFGWTIDEKTSFTVLDAFVDQRLQLSSIPPTSTPLGAGHAGGESEAIIGKWLRSRRQARSGRPGHQGRRATGRRHQGPEARLHPQILRELAPAPANGLRRSLPVPPGRPETPLEETLSGLRPAGEARQGPRHRRLQLQRRRARRSRSKVSAATDYPRYSPAAGVQPLRARRLRSELDPLSSRKASASSLTSPSPAASSPASTAPPPTSAKAPRGGGIGKKYLNDRGFRILAALDEVAAATQAPARRHRPRLAHRPPQHHRPHRQRHLSLINWRASSPPSI